LQTPSDGLRAFGCADQPVLPLPHQPNPALRDLKTDPVIVDLERHLLIRENQADRYF
jgi:hypothetical protein